MAVPTKKLIILDSVESTNNYAMGLIKSGKADHGISVFAIDQTNGRGRRGRGWITEPGANIQVSFITQMDWASVSAQFQLSMAAALSVIQLIQESTNLKAFVKWPNDIFINDKKAAGILIENVIHGHLWQWAVTGIGLNVNQRRFPVKTATSLSLESNQSFDLIKLVQQLNAIYLSYVSDWKKGKNLQWTKRYNSFLFRRDEEVKIQYGSRVFKTRITGVTETGKLCTKDTFEREWDLEQVRIRL